jgi:dipeptidyl aminopeptidase/acylaminoacyl peptidase
MRPFLLFFSFCLFADTLMAQQKRPVTPADYYRFQTISDPQVSPDGKWIVYTLSTIDTVNDKRNRDLWMVSWDGQDNVQLTNGPGNESSARFSPDGKYISFVASRENNENDKNEKKSQVYILDRRGGEAIKLTNVKGDIQEYVWKPDGSGILLVMKDRDFADTAKTKIRKPYVMDRYQFKRDNEGYLDNRKNHLYYFDIKTKKTDTLTTGNYDETNPVFSPDGNTIAFVSNRTPDPDKNDNTDIFIMDAMPGALVKKLTSWPGHDVSPQWSPDGKWIAYLQSSSDRAFTMYGENYLAVISKEGGEPLLLSKQIDRPVRNPRWNSDGQSISVLMEDDRECHVVSFDRQNGQMTKITQGDNVFSGLEMKNGNWVTMMSDPQMPVEIYALEKNNTRRLTHVQDSFLAPLQLATVEGFRSRSKDGTTVSGLLYRPFTAVKGQKLPLILFIHGGPVSQDGFEFDLTRQIYASAGFAVSAVNYRGSSGRGKAFTESIFGDWGNKEVLDIVGAANYLIKEGIADENNMGIAGWSYGGISTNYTIASDQRFKAAVSGAGSSMQLSMYGSDQYISQYENELGLPWKNLDKWLKVSYPFLHADKIKTPTLFMASQNDFNVPVIGAEQMYQALRSIGVPTELVIYPNQNHGLVVPSYIRFRYEKHLAWFNKYLRSEQKTF